MKALKEIAKIYNDYSEKFGIPRQSGLVENVISKIVFEKEYSVREAFSRLDEFSHIWIIWGFSKSEKDTWSPTVRPPRLGGNRRAGVFATRSPYRPNPIALSCVRIKEIAFENSRTVIYVYGADILSGSPIYDIKPYIPYCDCIHGASEGYTKDTRRHSAAVLYSDEVFAGINDEDKNNITQILKSDPRPSYITAQRVYKMSFSSYEVTFIGEGDVITIEKIEKQD